MTYDLYPLSPSLKPCEPVDTTDSRYLNQQHTPLANPLKKVLHIELYNEKWFSKPIPTSAPPIMYQHDTLTLSNDTPLSFLFVSYLHKETRTCPPTHILEKDDDFLSSPSSPLALHNSLTHSNCLFFIRYIPENTLNANWFLIQINHAETTTLNMNSKATGSDYHVTFMSRHSDDVKPCDDKARW